MPRVAYSEEDRKRIRKELLRTALELMSEQGIQHTTVEQIYRAVGISRTFFYTFFPTKEDLIVETLYLQQPYLVDYARSLMTDPSLSWREGVYRFLESCCYGGESGIAVLSVEEQQMIFRRLSEESFRAFRTRQMKLFGDILECFGICPNRERVSLFINLSLSVVIITRAIPQTLPMFMPEACHASADVQIRSIVDCLEEMRNTALPESTEPTPL